MKSYSAAQTGVIGLPVVMLAVMLALVAAWGMRSKAQALDDPAGRDESMLEMSRMSEASGIQAAARTTRVQLFGDSEDLLVEFLKLTEGSVEPVAWAVVPAGGKVAVQLRREVYRVHVTQVDLASRRRLNDNPRNVSFVEVSGSPIIVELGRLAVSRMPFPRAGY